MKEEYSRVCITRYEASNLARRVRRGRGEGFEGFGRTPIWDVNIEVTETPPKIQKTANFITVVA